MLISPRSMSLTLVILAAGIGRRYGGPKQIDRVGPAGETLLDYAVYDAARAGFGRVILALPAGFVAPPGRSKPWGTGHATLAAARGVDGPFAVINADDFYGAGSYRAL